jgi:hypothetical protein
MSNRENKRKKTQSNNIIYAGTEKRLIKIYLLNFNLDDSENSMMGIHQTQALVPVARRPYPNSCIYLRKFI